MQLPVQITWRNMDSSPAVEAKILEEAAKLEEFYSHIIGCRVMVEIPHQHQQRGHRFHVRIDLTVPGTEIVVNHEPTLHGNLQRTAAGAASKSHDVDATHKDMYLVIRDAFKTARHQLQDYARKQKGEVKHHESLPQGRVVRVFPEGGYGFIESLEGEEVYFHRNSVIDESFEQLGVGAQVRFVPEKGEKGLQASTVHLVGR